MRITEKQRETLNLKRSTLNIRIKRKNKRGFKINKKQNESKIYETILNIFFFTIPDICFGYQKIFKSNITSNAVKPCNNT